MSESLLAETEAAMKRLGEPRIRDPEAEGKMVALFIKTLKAENTPPEMVKDLAVAYILRL